MEARTRNWNGGFALKEPIRVLAVAVFFNVPWELAQSVLYVDREGTNIPWWHCLPMSLGDGLLVLLIFATGWIIFGRPEWFKHPGARGYALMVAAGLAISIPLEWVMVHKLERWAYTASMPLIPWLDIGVTPVVQMLVLPPMVFEVVAASGRGLAPR